MRRVSRGCVQHKSRKFETVETRQPRAERLEDLGEPKQEGLGRTHDYNDHGAWKSSAKQSKI